MILKRISVKNFRSIRDITVDVGHQMSIVGGNGAGKSTVLRAIDRFYGQSASVEADDFFGRQLNEQIEIALTFTNFNEVERETFGSRIHNEEMTVVRVFDAGGGKSNGRYYGATRQHPGFSEIRNTTGATPQRAAYNALRSSGGEYSSLPSINRADQIASALAEWEALHPDQCELARDDGQFFGFTNVAKGALQKATSFVFIPAVRDASADALDARGAVISRLLELVVRSAIQKRTDILSFQSRISTEYRELTDPEKLHELSGLSDELSNTLQLYYKEAAVALHWQPTQDFAVPLPAADVLLNDDGFEGPVDRKGHGLQRAFILTLLQHLAKATSAEAALSSGNSDLASPEVSDSAPEETTGIGVATNEETVRTEAAVPLYTLPGLILAIEEPELYQHPTKQRHFARVLSQLSAGQLPGVARQTQVLFATHSALFVSMDRFEEVSLARRHKVAGSDYKECKLTFSTLADVARRLEQAHEKPEGTYSAEGLRGRLHVISAEIAEGFFADTVVLVEGVSDRAAIAAAAAYLGIDLEGLGIAILAVDSITKLDRPTAIFAALNIPTFVLWDCDRGNIQSAQHSRTLKLLMGVPAGSASETTSIVAKTFACFETKLETVLKAELGGPLYQTQLDTVKQRYGIERNSDAEKAPFVMSELLAGLATIGQRSTTLENIVHAIVALRNRDALNESTISEAA
ncbi:AAA family ATPase [Bradyrhizobium sp. Ash2021]|uniref:ATP-dependent nuclease n=1 Tax=Bradyrhizobium sp. Ash2021 TaxID=2954771 RepID=UPI0028164FA2|nr:AAA family ATPase [Bradyrhizobium sp. Ash2021]WMT73878.1 ATP-dependent endonuclease [Bradyrhizobium sp. Ash2021]